MCTGALVPSKKQIEDAWIFSMPPRDVSYDVCVYLFSFLFIRLLKNKQDARPRPAPPALPPPFDTLKNLTSNRFLLVGKIIGNYRTLIPYVEYTVDDSYGMNTNLVIV